MQKADDEVADLDAAIFLQKQGGIDVCDELRGFIRSACKHAYLQVKRKRNEERQALLTKQEKESPWYEYTCAPCPLVDFCLVLGNCS